MPQKKNEVDVMAVSKKSKLYSMKSFIWMIIEEGNQKSEVNVEISSKDNWIGWSIQPSIEEENQ